MRELEIDPVAMAGDSIVRDVDVARAPEMDAVSGPVLGARRAVELVARYATADRPREVDPEKRVLDPIILNPATMHFADPNRGAIFDVTRRDVAEHEAAHGDVVRLDAQRVRGARAVDNRARLAADRQRPVDDDRRLACRCRASRRCGRRRSRERSSPRSTARAPRDTSMRPLRVRPRRNARERETQTTCGASSSPRIGRSDRVRRCPWADGSMPSRTPVASATRIERARMMLRRRPTSHARRRRACARRTSFMHSIESNVSVLPVLVTTCAPNRASLTSMRHSTARRRCRRG